MCENRCKILSVSGTPIHSSTAIATSDCKDSDDPSSDVYKPLIACLNTEQRKAGGYFKMYLENKKEKVRHCISDHTSLYLEHVVKLRCLLIKNIIYNVYK